MNEIVPAYDCSIATGARIGLAAVALFAANLGAWPTNDPPVYISTHNRASFSSFKETVTFGYPSMDNFEQEIVEVYAMLSEGQEPLGTEFEAIWDANASQLYNS